MIKTDWHGVHEVLARKLDESVTIRSVRRDDVLHMWFCVGGDVRAAALVCKL